MLRWRILLLVCWVIVSGCVAVRHVPLSESDSNRVGGKAVQRSLYQKPDFAAFTAGKAGFGPIGAALIIQAGNDLIRENAVDDPAIRIGQELAQALARRYGVQVLQAEPRLSESDDVGALLQTYGDADVVLDIKTISWAFIYFPTDWDNYRVLYSARLRLIDRQRNEVIAEEFCAYQPEYEDTNKAPTREDLVGNNAAGLKRELAKAADHCIALFRANAFRM
jgi:hypothetical protein